MVRQSAFRALAAAALVASTGCTLMPDYQRPAVSTPDRFTQTVEEGAGIADLAWWALFEDPALAELVRIALEENQDLRLATERVLESRARLGLTRSQQLPSVTASASAGVQNPIDGQPLLPGLPPGDSSDLYSASVDVSWELDLFGRLRSATAAERAVLLATEATRRAVTLALVGQVATAYFELRELDAQVEITRSTVVARERSANLARLRFEGGAAAETDFRQAESELLRTQVTLADLERRVSQKEHQLARLLGRVPKATIRRGWELAEQPVPAEVPPGLPSALLERRPDLVAAEQQLIAANAQIGVARALLYPTIALTGSLGGVSSELDELTGSSGRSSSLVAGLLAPIFEFGAHRRRVEVSESQMRAAAIAYESAVLDAFREVEDALVAVDNAGRRIGLREAQVRSQREVLRLAELRWEGGVTSYLEVLDAQRFLLSAELDLSSTRREQLVALVQLYTALGGGWSEPENAPTSP